MRVPACAHACSSACLRAYPIQPNPTQLNPTHPGPTQPDSTSPNPLRHNRPNPSRPAPNDVAENGLSWPSNLCFFEVWWSNCVETALRSACKISGAIGSPHLPATSPPSQIWLSMRVPAYAHACSSACMRANRTQPNPTQPNPTQPNAAQPK